MLTYFAPNPPKPEITCGEFPFTLTYELDGKTYHCPKFAAYDTNGDGQLSLSEVSTIESIDEFFFGYTH